jgi:hypothetical protein
VPKLYPIRVVVANGKGHKAIMSALQVGTA